MGKKSVWTAILVTCAALNLFAQKFEFKDRKGDKFHITSTTREEVFLITDSGGGRNGAGRNGSGRSAGESRELLQTSNMAGRMAAEVLETGEGGALIKAVFNVAEEITSGEGRTKLEWAEEYISEFRRNSRGKITIDGKYFMPVIRDVPYFPEEEILPGHTWQTSGTEVLDLRKNFEIAEPYSIPFTATSKYTGAETRNGKEYKVFHINWTLYKKQERYLEESPEKFMTGRGYYNYSDNLPGAKGKIETISGKAESALYWDERLSQIAYAEDEFSIQFELADGKKYLFHGLTKSELAEAAAFDKDKIAGSVRQELEELGIKDTEADVKVTEEGVSISLEDIRFQADSAELPPSEKIKLDKIALILKKHEGRDILVEGHTALAGRPEMRQKLSAERAGAVASYLIEKKVRTGDRIIIKASGATKPVADNSTEAGRRKNRRVEIVILEN